MYVISICDCQNTSQNGHLFLVGEQSTTKPWCLPLFNSIFLFIKYNFKVHCYFALTKVALEFLEFTIFILFVIFYSLFPQVVNICLIILYPLLFLFYLFFLFLYVIGFYSLCFTLNILIFPFFLNSLYATSLLRKTDIRTGILIFQYGANRRINFQQCRINIDKNKIDKLTKIKTTFDVSVPDN